MAFNLHVQLKMLNGMTENCILILYSTKQMGSVWSTCAVRQFCGAELTVVS